MGVGAGTGTTKGVQIYLSWLDQTVCTCKLLEGTRYQYITPSQRYNNDDRSKDHKEVGRGERRGRRGVERMEELLHHFENEPRQLRELRERRKKGNSIAANCSFFAKERHRYSNPCNATGDSTTTVPSLCAAPEVNVERQ